MSRRRIDEQPAAQPAERPIAVVARVCPRDGASFTQYHESSETVYRCPQCHWTERITQGAGGAPVVEVQPGIDFVGGNA